jgi:hypothetical protein
MKEIEELSERIDGAYELIDSLIKKIPDNKIKQVKTTDYSLHFEAIQKIFEVFLVRYNKESAELIAAIGKLDINDPAEKLKQVLTDVKPILAEIKKLLPVKVSHYFDPKTKGWIIAGMILLIVTAISTGLCGHLWVENNRLQAVDIKYRLLQQIDTVGTKWADSLYNNDADKAMKTFGRLESGEMKFTETNKVKKLPTTKRSVKRRVKPN